MIRIAILLLLLALPPTGMAMSNNYPEDEWIAEDKAAHLFLSTVAGGMSESFWSNYDYGRKKSDIKVFATGMAPGLFKEFAMDRKPSYKDLTVDVVGVLLGMYGVRWLNVRSEHGTTAVMYKREF